MQRTAAIHKRPSAPPLTALTAPQPTDRPAIPPANITADSTDAALLNAMRRDPHLLHRTLGSATQATDHARGLYPAPLAHISARWDTAQRAIQAGWRLHEQVNGWHADAPDQRLAAQVPILRAALVLLAEMNAVASASAAERIAMEKAAKHQVALGGMAADMNRARMNETNRPKWSGREFILQLAQRGCVLSVTPEGDIRAIFAEQLSPADREVLRLHKAEIVADLTSATKVA